MTSPKPPRRQPVDPEKLLRETWHDIGCTQAVRLPNGAMLVWYLATRWWSSPSVVHPSSWSPVDGRGHWTQYKIPQAGRDARRAIQLAIANIPRLIVAIEQALPHVADPDAQNSLRAALFAATGEEARRLKLLGAKPNTKKG